MTNRDEFEKWFEYERLESEGKARAKEAWQASRAWLPIAQAPQDQDILCARKVKGKWAYEVCKCFQGRFICDIGTPTHFQYITEPE